MCVFTAADVQFCVAMAEILTSATRLTHIPLANGVLIPRLGLGTFRARDDNVRKAVLCALQCGYTHIGNFSLLFFSSLAFVSIRC